tara:strand:- start:52 stop:636 length:585 start_codon:yes stop_codon:yes gene_type:complete
MKKWLFISLVLTFFNASAQFEKVERDNKIYIYKSFEDFKSDNGEYIGEFEDFASSPIYNAFGFFFMKENGKKRYVGVKKSNWGFRVGEHVFRKQKAGENVVLGVLKHKEKVFYISGAMVLRMLGNEGKSGWSSDSNVLFYSDNYESDVFRIDKLLKKEKDNSSFFKLNKCLEEAKRLEGNQAKFKASKSCIENF